MTLPAVVYRFVWSTVATLAHLCDRRRQNGRTSAQRVATRRRLRILLRSGGVVFCMDVKTGRLLWSNDGLFDAVTSVAVNRTGVYAPTVGYYTYRLDLQGGMVWSRSHYYDYAPSIAGQTPVLHGSRVWTHDSSTQGATDLGTIVTTAGKPLRHYDSDVLAPLTETRPCW